MAKTILKTFSIVWCVFISLDLVLNLLKEVKYLGRCDYGLIHALEYILLSCPERSLTLLPWALFLGTLLGLSQLAANNELLIMRSSNYTFFKLLKSILKIVIIIVILCEMTGEWISPYTDQLAKQLRMEALSEGKSTQTSYGTWMKYESEFIHIKEFKNYNELYGITRYLFDRNDQLISVRYSKKAIENQSKWQFYDTQVTFFKSDSIQKTFLPLEKPMPFINTDIFEISDFKHLERATFNQLSKSIDYRLENNLEVNEYQFAIWQKIMRPFILITLASLALPLVLGPLRRGGQVNNLVIGAFLTFVITFFVQVFDKILQNFSVDAWVRAFLPWCFYLGLNFCLSKIA